MNRLEVARECMKRIEWFQDKKWLPRSLKVQGGYIENGNAWFRIKNTRHMKRIPIQCGVFNCIENEWGFQPVLEWVNDIDGEYLLVGV